MHVWEGRNVNFLLDATAFRVSVGENGSVFDSAGAEKEVNRNSNVGKCWSTVWVRGEEKFSTLWAGGEHGWDTFSISIPDVTKYSLKLGLNSSAVGLYKSIIPDHL